MKDIHTRDWDFSQVILIGHQTHPAHLRREGVPGLRGVAAVHRPLIGENGSNGVSIGASPSSHCLIDGRCPLENRVADNHPPRSQAEEGLPQVRQGENPFDLDVFSRSAASHLSLHTSQAQSPRLRFLVEAA